MNDRREGGYISLTAHELTITGNNNGNRQGRYNNNNNRRGDGDANYGNSNNRRTRGGGVGTRSNLTLLNNEDRRERPNVPQRRDNSRLQSKRFSDTRGADFAGEGKRFPPKREQVEPKKIQKPTQHPKAVVSKPRFKDAKDSEVAPKRKNGAFRLNKN